MQVKSNGRKMIKRKMYFRYYIFLLFIKYKIIFSLTWKPSLWPGGRAFASQCLDLIDWSSEITKSHHTRHRLQAGLSSHFWNLATHFCNSNSWLLDDIDCFLSVMMRWDTVPLNQVLINYLWRVIQNWFGFCCLFVSRFLINLHRPARALEPGLHCIAVLSACNLVTAFNLKTRPYKDKSSL